MEIRKPYDVVPRIYGTIIDQKEDKCQQKFEIESNINNIMAKYNETGIIGNPLKISNRKPIFGDFSSIPSFQEANQMIIDTNNAFATLPSDIREKFGNDPNIMLHWLNDPKNNDDAIRLGLVSNPNKEVFKNETKTEPKLEPKPEPKKE